MEFVAEDDNDFQEVTYKKDKKKISSTNNRGSNRAARQHSSTKSQPTTARAAGAGAGSASASAGGAAVVVSGKQKQKPIPNTDGAELVKSDRAVPPQSVAPIKQWKSPAKVEALIEPSLSSLTISAPRANLSNTMIFASFRFILKNFLSQTMIPLPIETDEITQYVLACRSIDNSGMINSGNQCFRNAILHLILTAAPLASMIRYIGCNEVPIVGTPLLAIANASSWFQLGSLVRAVDDCSIKGFPINPDDHLAKLSGEFRKYCGRDTSQTVDGPQRQEDAMEFLTFILNGLHEEMLALDTDVKSLIGPEVESVAVGVDTSTESIHAASAADSWEPVVTKRKSGTVWQPNFGSSVTSIDLKSTVPSKTSGSSHGDIIRVRKTIVDQASRDSAYRAVSATVVSRLFHTVLRSDVLYASKKQSSCTFQPVHCLSLDIGSLVNPAVSSVTHGTQKQIRGNSALSLEEVLQHYFSVEEIFVAADRNRSSAEKNIHGPHSQKSASWASKKLVVFDALPPFLVMQLNRFAFNFVSGDPVKLHREIGYPQALQLRDEWMSEDLRNSLTSPHASSIGPSRNYQLYAVVMHHGERAVGGHYTVYCRGVDNVWRHFDDQRVSEISSTEVLAATDCAYVLLYSNVQCKL